MNKFLLSLFALTLTQGLWAQDRDLEAAPSIVVAGQRFLLDPIDNIKFRPLSKASKFGLNMLTSNELKDVPRSVDLKAFQSSIKNQGNRGSCTFFATNALLEGLIKERQGQEVNLSEEYFTWITKAKKGFFPKMEGSRAEYNARALIDYGFMLEQDLPFQPSFFDKGMPCDYYKVDQAGVPAFCYSHNQPDPVLNNRVISAKGFQFQTIDSNSEIMVKTLASTNSPIVIGVPVHPKGWNKAQVEMTPAMMKECTDNKNLCGGHAVLVTGYDLIKRVFTFKNSWGVVWGDAGYGTISFDYIDQTDKRVYLTGELTENLSLPSVTSEEKVRDLKILSMSDEVKENALQFKVNVSASNIIRQAYRITVALVTKTEEDKDELLTYLPVENKEAESFWLENYTLLGTKPAYEKAKIFKFSLENFDKESLKGRTEVFARVTTYYVDDDGDKKVQREYVKVNFPL